MQYIDRFFLLNTDLHRKNFVKVHSEFMSEVSSHKFNLKMMSRQHIIHVTRVDSEEYVLYISQTNEKYVDSKCIHIV